MSNRATEPKISPLLSWAAGMSWRLLVIAGVLAVTGYVVARLTLVVVPTLVAILVASATHPATARLVQRGVPEALAALIVLAFVVIAIVASAAFIVPAVADEVGTFSDTLSTAEDGLADWFDNEPFGLSRSDVTGYIDQAGRQVADNRARIASGVLGAAAGFLQIAAATVLALVLSFFFVKDRDRIWEWIVDKFPSERRNDVIEAGRRAWETMQGYVRGITIIAVVDAVLIGIALVIVQIPLALPLAALVFLGAFVPIVGAFVSGSVAVLVALLTRGVAEAAIIALSIIAIQQLEGNVLQPVVMGRSVKLHPVVILLAVASGIIVAGVAGAFLSVPIVATASAAGSYLKERREERPGEGTPTH